MIHQKILIDQISITKYVEFFAVIHLKNPICKAKLFVVYLLDGIFDGIVT
jgi:hypothetical protein